MCRCERILTAVVVAFLLAAPAAQADKKVKIRASRSPALQPIAKTVSTRPAEAGKPRLQGNPISDKLNTLYERTNREFRNAIYYKPSERSVSDQDRNLAPLLVQEVGDLAAVDGLHIGAVDVDAQGQATVDTRRPVVYSSEGYVRLGEAYCRQYTHIWATPGEGGRGVRWHGVRTTYGTDGWPLTWEILNRKDEPVVLFVAKAFEQAAQKQFGAVLTGRRHASERSRDEQPNVVVARVLPDGKEPAGPVVYQDVANRDVTTLLCRCMKAQVDNFVENNYYDLQPVEILTDVHVATSGPFRLEPGPVAGKTDPEHPWLAQALRIPRRF